MKSAELLVSLLFTQRHGYHLLDDAEVDTLCKTYGAVDDLLVFVTEVEASFQSLTLQRVEATAADPAFGRPFRPLIDSAASPTSKPPYLRVVSAKSSRQMIRFMIPPSIVMFALISLATAEGTTIFSSDGQSLSDTYERLTAIAIGAFLRVACRKRVASLFSDFGDSRRFGPAGLFDDHEAFSQIVARRQEASSSSVFTEPLVNTTTSLPLPEGKAGPRYSMQEAVAETLPFMVSLATANAPRNDVAVYGRGVVFGLENKLDDNTGVIGLSQLLKRGRQQGARAVELTVPCDVLHAEGEEVKCQMPTTVTAFIDEMKQLIPEHVKSIEICEGCATFVISTSAADSWVSVFGHAEFAIARALRFTQGLKGGCRAHVPRPISAADPSRLHGGVCRLVGGEGGCSGASVRKASDCQRWVVLD